MLKISKADQRILDDKRREAEVKQAYGEWLSGFDWEHYSTLTFDSRASAASAQKQYVRWVKRLERRAAGELSWFYTIERGASGYLHIHTLTAGTRWLGTRRMAGAWYSGHAQSLAYDRSLGAAYYITKDVGQYAIHYDFHLANRHQATVDLRRQHEC